jgi:hypothetical protein
MSLGSSFGKGSLSRSQGSLLEQADRTMWSVDTKKAKSPNPKVEEGDRHRPGDDAPTD